MSTISIPWQCITVIIGLCLCVIQCNDHLQPAKIDTIPCESELFCDGRFLHAIQLSGIFSDSKEFVDRPLRVDSNVVMSEFNKLLAPDKKLIPQALIPRLENLVDSYFLPVGSDLEECPLDDWREDDVPLFRRISDRNIRSWAAELHGKWKDFGRKTAQSVIDHPTRHSLIALPHPFISPGEVTGRFREQHYWDSYWTIHGLLISGMNATAKGMIINFASLVDSVPDAEELIKYVLPAIEREYHYWMTFRAVDITVDGRKFTVNRYKGSVTKPRPESYREDLETARSLRNRSLPGVEDKLFANIAAASASGWEFSSRWLDLPNKPLSELRTEDIVPVDLNAIMCATEESMGTFYKLTGADSKSSEFMTKATQRGDAIQAVFWSEPIKMWRDYDLKTQNHRRGFYLSSITPLFASCSSSTVDLMDTQFLRDIINSRDIKRALKYPGGIPVSFVNAKDDCHSCQWDFPNMWPTMQLMLIEAVARNADLRSEASSWAQNLVNAIHGGYMTHGAMFENYNVNRSGHYGVGGEYVVQQGYAPTNGAILRLLELFPRLNSDANNNEVFDKDNKHIDSPLGPKEAQLILDDHSNGLASSDQPAIHPGETLQFLAQMHTADPSGDDQGSKQKAMDDEYSGEGPQSAHSKHESLPSKRAKDNPGNSCQTTAASFTHTASILLMLVIRLHNF